MIQKINIESGCAKMPTLKGSKWSKFKLLRRRVMRNLIAWKNKEKLEAVFPEDYQKVNDLTDAIHFLDSLEYGEFYDKCPMCGEADLTIGKAEPVCFNAIRDEDKYRLGKIEGLEIQYCYNCGWYAIRGW